MKLKLPPLPKSVAALPCEGSTLNSEKNYEIGQLVTKFCHLAL